MRRIARRLFTLRSAVSLGVAPLIFGLAVAHATGSRVDAPPSDGPRAAASPRTSTTRPARDARPDADDKPATRPARAADDPVILFYEVDRSHPPPPHVKRPPREPLEVAVWRDGRIVWRAEGSLLAGRIAAERVAELLQRVDANRLADTTRRRHLVPDTVHQVMEVHAPGGLIQLASCHELFERNPKLVGIERGILALEGRDREAVLAAQPREYREFRRVWSDLRTTVTAWIPAEGKKFTGTHPLRRGRGVGSPAGAPRGHDGRAADQTRDDSNRREDTPADHRQDDRPHRGAAAPPG